MITRDKIDVKRLKLSGPMVGFSVHIPPGHRHAQQSICRMFSENCVNLSFIVSQQAAKGSVLFGCVDENDRVMAEKLVRNDDLAHYAEGRIIPDLTLMSIFPHQSCVRSVFQMLEALNLAEIPIHGIASSIAAVTFALDTDRIQKAKRSLEACIIIKA